PTGVATSAVAGTGGAAVLRCRRRHSAVQRAGRDRASVLPGRGGRDPLLRDDRLGGERPDPAGPAVADTMAAASLRDRAGAAGAGIGNPAGVLPVDRIAVADAGGDRAGGYPRRRVLARQARTRNPVHTGRPRVALQGQGGDRYRGLPWRRPHLRLAAQGGGVARVDRGVRYGYRDRRGDDGRGLECGPVSTRPAGRRGRPTTRPLKTTTAGLSVRR